MKRWGVLLALLLLQCSMQAQSLLGSNPALPQIHARTLAWADYDGDGDADLLMGGDVPGGSSSIYLLRNDQTAFVPVSHPFHAWAMASAGWGDLDGDGDPDLLQTGMKPGPVTAGGGKGATALWRNDGSSGFTAIPCGVPGVRSGSVKWVDLDGDGDQDCLVAGDNYDQGYIAVVARNSGGTLQAVATPMRGFCCGEFAAEDMDGDSLPDVLTLGENREGAAVTSVWMNLGGFQFAEAASGLPPMRNGSVAAGDMDGDGDADLVLSGMTRPYTLGLWENNTLGLAPLPALQQAGVANGCIRMADMDGDSLVDVVYGGNEPGGTAVVRTLRQFPSGTFTDTQPGSPLLGLHLPCIAVADWSGDGHPDIALSGMDGAGLPVALLYKWNNITKQFEP